MPKLPNLSAEAVRKRQVLSETMRQAREAAPPPPAPRKKVRIAGRITGAPSRKSKTN